MDDAIWTERKARAATWFGALRDDICFEFERLEALPTVGPQAERSPGLFEKTPTRRQGSEQDSGGGLMSVMRQGRVFEKVGVNVSEVYGTLSAAAMTAMKSRKGSSDDPRFWASGVSLVAHMNSPKVPAVHMNTRMFWTPSAVWFGGGSDLNPMVEVVDDTAFFHQVLRDACDKHDQSYYPKFKNWADEYFFIRHRNESRGVGGIFFDDHSTGDWEKDFAFTQDVGRAFLQAYVPIVVKHLTESWTGAERDWQLVKRGRYAEFNLVYDRGTQFGLQSGHNVEAVLMSMPPEAKWI
jgi:coproporphyrinogen III oxidase